MRPGDRSKDSIPDGGAQEILVRMQVFGVFSLRAFDGRRIQIKNRKTSALVAYLVLSGERDVPRKRLQELLWGGRFSDQAKASLRQSLAEIRRCLGSVDHRLLRIDRTSVSIDADYFWIDGVSGQGGGKRGADGRAEQFLESLLGISERFNNWIRSIHVEFLDGDSTSRLEGKSSSGPQMNSHLSSSVVLTVTPFVSVLDNSVTSELLNALTQEVSTTLARLRWLSIRIAHATSRSDSQYHIEGSVSRTSKGYRISVRLISEEQNRTISWTYMEEPGQTIDAACVNSLAEKIVGLLDPEILVIESRKASQKNRNLLSGYEQLLIAIPKIYSFERNSWNEGQALLLEAHAQMPLHPRICAYLSLSIMTGLAQGWMDPGIDLAIAEKHAATAIISDPHDSVALSVRAHLQSFLYHQFDEAQNLFHRAIRANPSCGITRAYHSLTLAYMGKAQEAEASIEKSRNTLLYEPYWSFLDACEIVARYFKRDWIGAIHLSGKVLANRPSFTNIRKILISCHCFLGESEIALEENARLLRYDPKFSWEKHLREYPFQRIEDRDDLYAALRKTSLIDAP